jgi:hypothetical protein
MRALRSLILAPVGIAVAALFVMPAGAASAATPMPAPPGAAAAAMPLKPSGTLRTGAVNPECKLFYLTQQGKPGGVAHISSFLLHHHKIRAVKINAQVQCRRVSMNVIVRVTLWKTGAIFPHRQAGPTMAGPKTTNSLKNQMTFRECKNFTKSTFYGTAFASVVFQGVKYSASLQSAKATLACGT